MGIHRTGYCPTVTETPVSDSNYIRPSFGYGVSRTPIISSYQSYSGNNFDRLTSSNWNGRSITIGTSLLTLAVISLLATGAQAYGNWVEQECRYDYWGNSVCWLKECYYEEVCNHFFGFAECHIEKVCYE